MSKMHALERFVQAVKLYENSNQALYYPPKLLELNNTPNVIRKLLVDIAINNRSHTPIRIDYNNMRIDYIIPGIGIIRVSALDQKEVYFLLAPPGVDSNMYEWRCDTQIPANRTEDHILNVLLQTKSDPLSDPICKSYLVDGIIINDAPLIPEWAQFTKVIDTTGNTLTLKEWDIKQRSVMFEWLKIRINYHLENPSPMRLLTVMETYFLKSLIDSPDHEIYNQLNAECREHYINKIFKHRTIDDTVHRAVREIITYFSTSSRKEANECFIKSYTRYIGRYVGHERELRDSPYMEVFKNHFQIVELI